MSTQTLNRWAGAYVIFVAALTLIGGLIRFVSLEMGGGNLALGQSLYTMAYLIGVFGFFALYGPHATRLGRLGFAGFILATLGITLNGIPAFIWLASVSGQEWGHAALMFAWGPVPVLTVGTFSAIIGYICFGLAAARSGVYPRRAGHLLVLSAVIDLPVELPMIGGMFTMIWPVSLILYVMALSWMGWILFRIGKAPQTELRPQPVH